MVSCGLAQASPWVSFEPCGYENIADEGLHGFAPAPGLTRIWVRRDIPGSILIPTMKPGSVPCVYIRAPGGQALVIGSEREVLCKLAPDRPECDKQRNHIQAGP